jgi:hypothetical protein
MEYERTKYSISHVIDIEYVYVDHEGLIKDVLFIIDKYNNSDVPIPIKNISEFLDVKYNMLRNAYKKNNFKPLIIQQEHIGQEYISLENNINLEIRSIVYSVLVKRPFDFMFLQNDLLPNTLLMTFQGRVRLGPKYSDKKDGATRRRLSKQYDTLSILFKYSKGKRCLFECKEFLIHVNFMSFLDDEERYEQLTNVIDEEDIVTISKRYTSAIFSPVLEIPPGDKRIILDMLMSDISTFEFFYLNETKHIVNPQKKLSFYINPYGKYLTVNTQRDKLEFNTSDLSPFMHYYHVEHIQKILNNFLFNYPVKRAEIIGAYFSHGIPIESVSSTKSKTESMLEPYLPKDYFSKCVKHQRPYVFETEEALLTYVNENRAKLEGYGINMTNLFHHYLEFPQPIFGIKGDPKFYSCIGNDYALSKGYIYIGLKKMGDSYFPCCYLVNQQTKKGSQLFKVFTSSSTGELVSYGLNENKILSKDSTGKIPPYISHLTPFTNSNRRGIGNLSDLLNLLNENHPFKNSVISNTVINQNVKRILLNLTSDNIERYLNLVSFYLRRSIVLLEKDYRYDSVFLKIKKIGSEDKSYKQYLVIQQFKDQDNIVYELIEFNGRYEIPDSVKEYIDYHKDAIKRERRRINIL